MFLLCCLEIHLPTLVLLIILVQFVPVMYIEITRHIQYQLNATSRVRVTSLASTSDLTRECE